MNPATFYQHLFADAGRACVAHLPQGALTEVIAGANAAECRIIDIDLANAHDRDSLFDALTIGFDLPNWFGRNWDALADCLQDLSWIDAKGYVVILRHCDLLNSSTNDDFTSLVELMNEVADIWREDEVPFWCLVDMLADGIAWLPSLPPTTA